MLLVFDFYNYLFYFYLINLLLIFIFFINILLLLFYNFFEFIIIILYNITNWILFYYNIDINKLIIRLII